MTKTKMKRKNSQKSLDFNTVHPANAGIHKIIFKNRKCNLNF